MDHGRKNGLFTVSIVLLAAIIFSAFGCDGSGSSSSSSRSSGSEHGIMEMPKNLLISLATGGAGGTYYVMGGGMPTIIEKAIPGSKLVVQSTAASTENARLVGKGDVEFGFNMPDGAYFATTGEREYAPTNEKYPKIKGVLAGHLSVCQAFTSKSSGITSFGQLKGKRISLSAPSSPSMYVSIAALEAYGLKEGDFSNAFMSYSEMADAVRNGSLDCGFSFGGIPTASALDLSMSIDTVIIGMEQDRAELAVKLFPYYSYGTIPANTYKGQTEDRIALTAPAIIITNDDVPENVVYYFTKALWENLDELKIIHPAFNEWVLEKAATGLGVPLHPGAERYYREVGVIE